MSPTNHLLRRCGGAAVDIGILLLFLWGGWWAIARQIPDLYRFFGVDPCGGQAICLSAGDTYAEGWPVVMLVVLAVVYLVGVFIVQRGLTGRTVGSMLFLLEVVGEDRRPIGINRALVRSVAGAVDYLPCLFPIVGVTTIIATPSRQRVGDMAAASIVIDARSPAIEPQEDTDHLPAGAGPIRPDEVIPDRPPMMGGDGPPTPPGPLWDPSRQAYVQWDPQHGGWIVYDATRQQWLRLTAE